MESVWWRKPCPWHWDGSADKGAHWQAWQPEFELKIHLVYRRWIIPHGVLWPPQVQVRCVQRMEYWVPNINSQPSVARGPDPMSPLLASAGTRHARGTRTSIQAKYPYTKRYLGKKSYCFCCLQIWAPGTNCWTANRCKTTSDPTEMATLWFQLRFFSLGETLR